MGMKEHKKAIKEKEENVSAIVAVVAPALFIVAMIVLWIAFGY